ncbi:hypothetical protein DV736_g5059, partial [Chaetothyriales sp. CBS 134916]
MPSSLTPSEQKSPSSSSQPTQYLGTASNLSSLTTTPCAIRRAFFSEQRAIARVCTAAFWNDVLFGQLIHPHRLQYPNDNDLYWLRRTQVDWWDWSHIFIVATTGKDSVSRRGKDDERIIIGQAHWSRIADSEAENYAAGWGLAWWDPRRLIKPIVSLCVRLISWLRPNRAADPEQEDIIERSYGFLDHIWTKANARSPSWYLESLAVAPAHRGQGVGRTLVQWGLDQAEKEGIACSVISAVGKERFYQRCGFDVGPVGRSGEGEGNPLDKVPGGLIFFREARAATEREWKETSR